MAAEKRINKDIPPISHAFFLLIFSNFILAQNKVQGIGWQASKPDENGLFQEVDRRTHVEKTTFPHHHEKIEMTTLGWIKKGWRDGTRHPLCYFKFRLPHEPEPDSCLSGRHDTVELVSICGGIVSRIPVITPCFTPRTNRIIVQQVEDIQHHAETIFFRYHEGLLQSHIDNFLKRVMF